MSIQELDKSQFTALILLTGVDAPGVTQALFDELSPFSITVLDIEQVVNRNRLILTALIALDPAHADAIESDLLLLGKRLDLDIAIDFSDVILESASSAQHLHVVMMAGALKPSAVSAVSGAIAAAGGNIERIRRTAAFPLYAIEFDVTISVQASDADSVVNLRKSLALVSRENDVDLAVELGGLTRRAKRIVLLDMDSTLIQQEVIDLLAEKAGVGDQVKAITESAMKGELDFKQSLTARVALLSGLKSTVLQEVARELLLSAGARTLIRTLHKLGHKVGVVSGGFINVIEPLLKELKIDFYSANELEIVDGTLTGKVVGGIIDRAAKAEALRNFAAAEGVSLSQTIAIGDGANDLDMIELAGLGIAFNAKPAVRMAADSSLTSPYLDSVLYLMGITREEVESAAD
ncbi:MAG: phosphoserine phosphatase SerB [Actinomycetes bacterium]